MRIGIDARPLVHRQRTGIGNYIYGLLQQLPQLAPEHEYFLYSSREIAERLPDAYVRRHPDPRLGRLPSALWLFSGARRDRLDVFWSTVLSVLPLWMPTDVVKVFTVYDLVWSRFPETMQGRNLWVHRLHAESTIRNCDRIIAISRSTAADLTRCFGVPPERVRLVYPALSEVYKKQHPHAAEQISRKYGTPSCYMAAVGNIEPRKNLSLLVRVLKMLKQRGQLNCPLLIAGASGWKNSALHGEIRASGLTEEDLRFLGYLPDEDLPLFYAGAKVFLFPSLYEGFGLPPLEAMACGTPVIASDAQPMREVLGDAAILESPLSPERFMEAIVRVLTDENLLREMRQRGLQRAQAFGQESASRQLLDALCSA